MLEKSFIMSKSERGFTAVETILVVGLVGIIAFAGYTAYQNMTKASAKKDATGTVTASPSTVTPASLIASAKAKLAAKYTLVDLDTNNHPTDSQVAIRVGKTGPPVKPAGYSYYTGSSSGASLDVLTRMSDGAAPTKLPNDSQIVVRKAFTDTLGSQGFSKTSSYGDSSNGNGYDVWSGHQIVCSVDQATSETGSNSLRCASESDYPAEAAKVKPMMDVYPNIEPTLVAMMTTADKSSVAGYERANVSTSDLGGGGSIALFYRHGTEAWRYFKNVQSELDCTMFNSADLRAAYAGTNCIDATGKQAKVK